MSFALSPIFTKRYDEPAKVPLAVAAMGRSFIALLARARVPSPNPSITTETNRVARIFQSLFANGAFDLPKFAGHSHFPTKPARYGQMIRQIRRTNGRPFSVQSAGLVLQHFMQWQRGIGR